MLVLLSLFVSLMPDKLKTLKNWFSSISCSIALEKITVRLIFFLFLHKNICCGYSLEVPGWGASNEYP